MIIWINGAFAAGKTTLAEELERRLPDAMPFDPEYVGYILIKWVPPADSGDFQDIPLWRRLVADFAIGMAADYGRPLIVPMTLVNDGYRAEIFGLIGRAAIPVLHVFLDVRPRNCTAGLTPGSSPRAIPSRMPTPWSGGVTSTRRPSWLISSSRPRADVIKPRLAK
jgi:hypothetical protein